MFNSINKKLQDEIDELSSRLKVVESFQNNEGLKELRTEINHIEEKIAAEHFYSEHGEDVVINHIMILNGVRKELYCDYYFDGKIDRAEIYCGLDEDNPSIESIGYSNGIMLKDVFKLTTEKLNSEGKAEYFVRYFVKEHNKFIQIGKK